MSSTGLSRVDSTINITFSILNSHYNTIHYNAILDIMLSDILTDNIKF